MQIDQTPNKLSDDRTHDGMAARQGVPSRRFALRCVSAVLAVLALLTVPMAQSASAARAIDPARGLICERYDNKLSISPPRVWASYRTEQVTWGLAIERWNNKRRVWVDYTSAPYYFYSSFTYFGMSVTSWSGGWYHNNTLNIPVYHRGYYRVYSAVWGNQGGVTQQGWIDGGRSCFVY